MIINQGYEEKQYNVPSLGLVTLKNLQNVNEDSVLGKALLKHFPSICLKETNLNVDKEVFTKGKNEKVEEPIKEEVQEVQLLVEEPVQVAKVETSKEEVEEIVQESTKPIVEEKPKRKSKASK